MKKQLRALIAVFLVFIIAISALPLTASAASSDYVSVYKNDSYNKDGKFYTSYTIENITNYYLTITGKYLDSSGKAVLTFNPLYLNVGEKNTWSFGMSFSGKPSGTYTFRLDVDVGNGSIGLGWFWKTNITHKAPTKSIAFKSYDTYYNDNGQYMHKISISCKNMKGERLYCKIVDSDGITMYDYGKDTPIRKTNDEVAWFAWSGKMQGAGYTNSGEYTFIISNSANNQIIEKTLRLTIPQGGNG